MVASSNTSSASTAATTWAGGGRTGSLAKRSKDLDCTSRCRLYSCNQEGGGRRASQGMHLNKAFNAALGRWGDGVCVLQSGGGGSPSVVQGYPTAVRISPLPPPISHHPR